MDIQKEIDIEKKIEKLRYFQTIANLDTKRHIDRVINSVVYEQDRCCAKVMLDIVLKAVEVDCALNKKIK